MLSPFESGCDDLFDQLELDGLLNKITGAVCNGIFQLRLCSDRRNDDNISLRKVFFDLPDGLDPVFYRHYQIQKNEIRLFLAGDLNGFFTVFRIQKRRFPERKDHIFQLLPGQNGIIPDENFRIIQLHSTLLGNYSGQPEALAAEGVSQSKFSQEARLFAKQIFNCGLP